MAEKRVDDGGAAELQAQFDDDLAKGFRGDDTDPDTPNEAYTLQGVTGSEPPKAQRKRSASTSTPGAAAGGSPPDA